MMFARHGVGTAGIDHVQLRFIRGKRDPIRLIKIRDDRFEIAGQRIKTEDITPTIFTLGNVPFVVG